MKHWLKEVTVAIHEVADVLEDYLNFPDPVCREFTTRRSNFPSERIFKDLV